MPDIFAVPVFFIVFRETLETSIVVSVLLSFLKQQLGPERDKDVYRKLRNQIWYGTLIGFVICLMVGCGLIGAFYGIGKDMWASAEYIWEGVFALIAALVIAVMGAALLRVSKMQDKWRLKLAKALEAKDNKNERLGNRFKLWAEKYAMFLLPFITILREGLEAVVFVGGVSLGLPASSIPLATVCGLAAGCAVGFFIYKGGNRAPLQVFLIVSTCFLYLVAAGLFSRGVWYLEADAWNKATGGDAAENGSGPGSYDIRKSVWHVNCCNPVLNGGGGWGIFNALLGWQNSATYGSVISYIVFWTVVVVSLILVRFKESRGHYPFMTTKATNAVLLKKRQTDDATSITGLLRSEETRSNA
ncbi:high-affinity iron transporter [Capronia epimyces CBS 606.96]|uniref:High-affinity iron transporter n=1 Tax=Capronia epimyces CBS 606.96 TaxID=1182542 RepID=W9Y3D1_9EURO|nr:high-affinity iron transporter [Capronia epimyces CBS 606.96]EXJ87322.1 high-affinity iron transporter [Capronia epimyces CBS 606.96]